jgi:hypothetical protein
MTISMFVEMFEGFQNMTRLELKIRTYVKLQICWLLKISGEFNAIRIITRGIRTEMDN